MFYYIKRPQKIVLRIHYVEDNGHFANGLETNGNATNAHDTHGKANGNGNVIQE
jgi:hypothetical protein